MKKIIVVEPGSAAIYISNAIKRLGYEPILLCSIDEYKGDQKEYIKKHSHYEVDARAVENITQCIKAHKIIDIFGIISTADRFIVPACQAALELGVKGMDAALLKLNNKAEVVRFIPEDSPLTLIFNRHSIPSDHLKDMLSDFGALVIKPASSGGAKGLFQVTTDEDIDCILEFMKKEKQVNVLDQNWLAQPVINGTLYSLEGFVINGQVHYIGLSRRSRVKYTESQNHFPVDDETDSKIYIALTQVLEKLIKASDYQKGYFHSEILFNGEKAFLIDANFGRVGGGSVALQIAEATGKSVEEIYAHVIETTFFPEHSNHPTFYPKEKSKTLSILYGVGQGSTLIGLSLPEAIQSSHTQLADIGQHLEPIGYDNRSWIGMLMGKPEAVLQDIQRISILTDQGILNPEF